MSRTEKWRELERKEEERRKEEEEKKSREGVRVVQVTDNFHFINHFSYVIKFCNYFFGLSS